jgi:CheY-like chemotaxis protein
VAKILIVEDESMEQLILRIILERAGHELFFAEDGEEALAIYSKEGIQVVITDLFLPHIGGLELIRVLKRLFPDAVVIAVSGKGSKGLAEAKVEGAVATLTKPIDPEELLELVELAVAVIERAPDNPSRAFDRAAQGFFQPKSQHAP